MKLSQRDELGGVSLADDTMHIVRSGLSYKRKFSSLLNTARIPFRISQTSPNREFIVFKKDPDSAVNTILAAGDFLIFIDLDDETIIIGIALAAVSSYPNDLRNQSKFMRFYEGTPLL